MQGTMLKDVYTLSDLRNWSEATADVRPPARLSVFGDPVAHSKSPAMHNAALAACGIDAQYVRLHILPDELAEAVRLLPKNGFIGTNVTIPHKSAMLGLMDEVDDHARKIHVRKQADRQVPRCGDAAGGENQDQQPKRALMPDQPGAAHCAFTAMPSASS